MNAWIKVHVYTCTCLTLLASFFLPSHLSFKNMYMYTMSCTLYTGFHTGLFVVGGKSFGTANLT